MARFIDIVEDVTSLSIEEMEEIKRIIEKILIEKRRDEILANHQQAIKDARAGKLFSSDNINEIMDWLKKD